MNNAAPENTAALQEKIAELEQQLKLSDEGVSHLAERCLSLEQKVQSYLAAHPQREMHTDSPTLLQPLLYYDAGFGFSEKDTLTAPDCTTDELTGAVTATFELPVVAQALRFDPGELPCCITNLIFSDDRIICTPTNGLNLSGGSTLFLGDDPNYRLEGTTHYPAGMKLVVSYGYFPLETLTDEPLFCAVLQGVQQLQLRKDSEKQHIQQLEQELGVHLFDRIGKQISLTHQGQVFYQYAVSIRNELEQAKNAVSDPSTLSGKLCLGTIESICASIFPDLLAEYHRLHPEVTISIVTDSPGVLLDRMNENTAEV